MTTATTEIEAKASELDDVVFEAPAVLRIVWTDPQHMPEHIAVWSLAHFGPRAEAAVEKLRREHPDATRDELERRVIDRQTKVAMTEGAFVGGPFIVLMAVGFCAALLAQAQMVFALAAVSGRDPKDEMRLADLLVLLGAYPSTETANAALAAMTRDPKLHEGGKLPRGTRWSTIMRMAYLLEVLGTSEDRSRLRATLGWIGVGVLFVVGFALPLVWVPYMAYSSRKFTVRLEGPASTTRPRTPAMPESWCEGARRCRSVGPSRSVARCCSSWRRSWSHWSHSSPASRSATGAGSTRASC